MNLPTTPTDKPATINTRSDAASANEMATAVAGAGIPVNGMDGLPGIQPDEPAPATVSGNAGSDTVPGGSIPSATVPAWKAACHIEKAKDGFFNIHSPTRSHFYASVVGWTKYPAGSYDRNALGSYTTHEDAMGRLADLTTPPPDWTEPTPATVSENAGSDTVPGGSIPSATVPAWKAACKVVKRTGGMGYSIGSPTLDYVWSETSGKWSGNAMGHLITYGSESAAIVGLAACTVPPPDWPTPAHTDDPREEPERFCEATGPVVGGTVTTTTSPDGRYSVTSFKPDEPGLHKVPMPVETVTYSDPSPCGNFVRKITKPAEPIEKLIDRLAHIRDCHKIDWQFQIRVTGDIEKAEPRSYDSPGYPEHFALHHVYLGEDLTRAILTTIAYDLKSNGMDRSTIGKVLDSVARAFQLTAEFGETDLIGMAVAVEDKLDIGKE